MHGGDWIQPWAAWTAVSERRGRQARDRAIDTMIHRGGVPRVLNRHLHSMLETVEDVLLQIAVARVLVEASMLLRHDVARGLLCGQEGIVTFYGITCGQNRQLACVILCWVRSEACL